MLTGAGMKVPELGLLQSANSGPQLGEASSVSKGPVVAAYGLLTVMLRLVQLSKLFPEPWLGWLPQQGLDTAMQGFQLPVEGSRGGCPRSIIGFVWVPGATAMGRWEGGRERGLPDAG